MEQPCWCMFEANFSIEGKILAVGTAIPQPFNSYGTNLKSLDDFLLQF